MIEENQYIILCTDEYRSLLSSDGSKQIQVCERQKGKICKQKNKRKQRLIWVPLIMKNILQPDTEPVYIYNLFKMMKNYDEDSIERYHNYGIIEAGIGIFDSVQFDKVYSCIEVSLTTYSIGQMDMSYLIQLYKSYQNQQYYDLSLALQEYSDYSAQHFQTMGIMLSLIDYDQAQIDGEFTKFTQTVKQWLDDNFENDVYEVCLGNLDIDKKFPVVKKLIYSKNLLLFIGEDLSETYNQISSQRNYDFLTNFLRTRTNGKDEIDNTIQFLKESKKRYIDLELDEKIETLDGFKIPCKKKMRGFYYDFKTGNITQEVNTHFFLLSQYTFEPRWIKFLIDQRLYFNKLNQEEKNGRSFFQDHMIDNFEYLCQKEYFYEKFKYKPKIMY